MSGSGGAKTTPQRYGTTFHATTPATRSDASAMKSTKELIDVTTSSSGLLLIVRLASCSETSLSGFVGVERPSYLDADI